MLELINMTEIVAKYAKLSACILFFTKINLDDFIHLWSWKRLYTSEKSARKSERDIMQKTPSPKQIRGHRLNHHSGYQEEVQETNTSEATVS